MPLIAVWSQYELKVYLRSKTEFCSIWLPTMPYKVKEVFIPFHSLQMYIFRDQLVILINSETKNNVFLVSKSAHEILWGGRDKTITGWRCAL